MTLAAESATLVTRDIPPGDYARFKAAAAERGLSMSTLSRQFIHQIAEEQRLKERAEALRAYSANPNRPQLDPEILLAGLHAQRERTKGDLA